MNEDKASAASQPEEADGVQGEGNYRAARRFDKASADFVKSHDVEKLAREAAPKSPADARSIAEAEEEGRRHSRGEDEDVPSSQDE